MPAAPISGNNEAKTLFDITKIPPGYTLQKLRIQNQGTTVVFVALNDDATAEVYNETLVAATGAKNGTGGVYEVDMGWKVTKVSVFSAGAFVVSSTLVLNKNNVRY